MFGLMVCSSKNVSHSSSRSPVGGAAAPSALLLPASLAISYSYMLSLLYFRWNLFPKVVTVDLGDNPWSWIIWDRIQTVVSNDRFCSYHLQPQQKSRSSGRATFFSVFICPGFVSLLPRQPQISVLDPDGSCSSFPSGFHVSFFPAHHRCKNVVTWVSPSVI